MMEKMSIDNETKKTQRSLVEDGKCKVCGFPSRNTFFGVVSCNACKMFFKRNAQRGKEILTCSYGGHCEINIFNRHVCSYCRLVKCFDSGMLVELIRPEYSKRSQPNKKRINKNAHQLATIATVCRLNSVQQLPTLNLLQTDQSTLTIDQWKLLSNLSNCYDEHSGLEVCQRFIIEQNSQPLKIRVKYGTIIKLIQTILTRGQLLYMKNQDFRSLCTCDRAILLRNTFAHIASLTSNFLACKSGLLRETVYFDAVETLTYPDILPNARRIESRLELDLMTMKLFLAILSFSTNLCTVNWKPSQENLQNLKLILHIQDRYIEVMWRYLIYKYDFRQAVLCLSELLRCYFAVNKVVNEMAGVEWITNTMTSIIDQTERSLVLDEH